MHVALEGKVVVVTGATRGIGRAISERLAPDGVRLALCGRDEAALRVVVEAVRGRGAREVYDAAVDLADPGATLDFWRGARAALGPVDILINNAGFNPRKAPVSEIEVAELDAVLAVNLRAPFILMREAVREMSEGAGGHIVNILSTVCHFSNETMGAYTAAKAGLRALADICRKEARPHGVRISSVYPGGTNTTFRAREREDYMSPASVAEAVHSLLVLPPDLVVHDLTFRPTVESNF